MSTLRNNKINNNKSSEPKTKSQEDFEKELEDFIKELEKLKRSVESMWRIGRWWDCGPFKPFTWLNVEEFKDVADNYIQLVKNNNFEGNREQISELIDTTLAKMETHPSSKMRSLFGYCIGKSHGFQGTSYNNIKRQNELKDETISKLKQELEQKIKESEKCVEEKLREEGRQLKSQLNNKIQKLEAENKEYRTKISELKEELRENREEKDREIKELKVKNQASNIEIEKMKQENQERDKQIETLMRLCSTFSLAQMVMQNTQQLPSTEMSNVQLSQSLPSLEK